MPPTAHAARLSSPARGVLLPPNVAPTDTVPPHTPQVGLTFATVSVLDVLAAALAVPIAMIVGQVAMLYLAFFLISASTITLAVGPRTWLAVMLAFIPNSLAVVPTIIITGQLLMLVCRTYDMDPKAYGDVIASLVGFVTTATLGSFALIGGAVVQAVGFRMWHFILTLTFVLMPFVLFWGFHPMVLGRPLAKEAGRETDAEEQQKRVERSEGKLPKTKDYTRKGEERRPKRYLSGPSAPSI